MRLRSSVAPGFHRAEMTTLSILNGVLVARTYGSMLQFCRSRARAGPQCYQGEERYLKNVELSVKGNTLTITVDLTKEFGPSSSGKTIIVASTEGSFPLPGRSEVVGLNIYRKK